MKLLKRIGVTSEIWQIFVQDNSKTTGEGLTSLSATNTSVLCYYKRNNASAAVAVTLADMTLGAYTSGGLKAVANMPGFYDFCPPDAALATGASSVAFLLYPATTTVVMAPVPIEVQLTQADLEDAADLGLTNLDAAVSTRLPSSSYVAPDNTSTAAIKAKTDQMTFSSGDILATLAGEPVAVGSYATTTAAPLQPMETVEGSITVQKALRAMLAALAGKSSGHTSGASSPKYRDQADTKDRISATTDANGNRSAVTLDLD